MPTSLYFTCQSWIKKLFCTNCVRFESSWLGLILSSVRLSSNDPSLILVTTTPQVAWITHKLLFFHFFQFISISYMSLSWILALGFAFVICSWFIIWFGHDHHWCLPYCHFHSTLHPIYHFILIFHLCLCEVNIHT